MKYFSKEKDTFLKVINAFLIVSFVFSIIIFIATGIQILNREPLQTYTEYAKDVCTIDKLEYECTDDECIKELDIERKKTCNNYYIEYKKEFQKTNKKNNNYFFISLATSAVLFFILHMLNKKI